MKRLALLLIVLSLGMFVLGCKRAAEKPAEKPVPEAGMGVTQPPKEESKAPPATSMEEKKEEPKKESPVKLP